MQRNINDQDLIFTSSIIDNNFYKNIILNNKYRKNSIQWIFEIIENFEFSFKILLRSINIFDSYLILNQTYLILDLKLISIFSIYLANKIEERNKFSLNLIKVKILKNKFSIEFLKKFEMNFLTSLNFKLINYLIFDNIYYYQNNWIFKLNKNYQLLIKKILIELKILQNYNIIEIEISIIYLINKIENKNQDINFLVKKFKIDKKNILKLISEILKIFKKLSVN